ncbi:insulinase family protein [Caloramator sp. E03]|uniref:M16 family metallopeptidase n=1 Tax=Caloramator sp. E03 TaxID=2576307 RepID=UPI0011100E69|nr:pitrilysin family protein [Caloramator sp. E03]QCX32287.1 insulinase family protein [Caloramator sp. E03]
MFKRYILNSNIRVITEYIPYVNSISIGIWIGSGSRYENTINNGVSHFIEHILFKGTKNRTAKQIASEIEELGGQINAFTGKEATCFYIKMLDEHYDIGIDVLSDMLLNPKFAQIDIEKEKSVIQEEINMYEDSPEDLVSDILSIATWGEDPLSYPILGTNTTIKELNKEKIINYFNETYVPENIVISITGNFEEDKLIKKLNETFGTMHNKNKLNLSLSYPKIKKDLIVKNKDIEQIHVALTLNGIELGNDKLYTLLAINNYFGGGTSSKLFQKLREEEGYVYTIYSFPSVYKNVGTFNIYFALNEQYINSAMELILHEINEILKHRMSKNDITKAKEQLKGNYILGLESMSSRMFSMGKSELMLGKVFEPKEILNKIDMITINDVDEVLDIVFKEGILSAAAVGRNIDEYKLEKALGGRI